MSREMVREFNRSHPVGTSVAYWPGATNGDPWYGETTSVACVLATGVGVVEVTGVPGHVLLTNVMPIPAPPEG